MKRHLFTGIILAIVIFLVYQGLVLFDNSFPFGRMRETPLIKPHEREILVMDKGGIPFSGGETIYRATPGEDLKSPLSLVDSETIKNGETLSATYCTQCHGKNHDGNGTVGQSFYPLPGDLRRAKVQHMPEGVLFKEISYGVPEGRQPPLATTIDVLDRWRIIAYVRFLGLR